MQPEIDEEGYFTIKRGEISEELWETFKGFRNPTRPTVKIGCGLLPECGKCDCCLEKAFQTPKAPHFTTDQINLIALHDRIKDINKRIDELQKAHSGLFKRLVLVEQFSRDDAYVFQHMKTALEDWER